MGCASCKNNDGSGTPAGCRSNGSCGTGGCNKLNVFDWLSNMELPSGRQSFGCVEVRFKNSRKAFYRNVNNIPLHVGDTVAVEASPGYDVGVVSIVGELTRLQMNKKNVNYDSSEIRKLYRKVTEKDLEKYSEARDLENDTMYKARKHALSLGLEMKISDVEYQGDKTKATFYYTADERVDFRELIKIMADDFKIRIEMRQIGARQEASRLGGVGSCGRELCCATWLTDFRSVSTSAARYQQLSLNPQKLAGQCGKLKCCLNYELDMYLEAIKDFPRSEVKLQTKKGTAFHLKTDIFKRTMWYIPEGDGINSPIPLSVDRVHQIIDMNKAGKKPDDLKDYMDIVVDEEPDYTNVVGQDSLTRFDDKHKKGRRKKRRKKPRNPQGAPTNKSAKGSNKGDKSGKGGKPKGQKPQAKKNTQGNNKPRQKNKR